MELGHSFNSSKISTNLNLYHTEWKNKPQAGSTVIDGETVKYNINGINALHRGVELDLVLENKPTLCPRVFKFNWRLAMDVGRRTTQL